MNLSPYFDFKHTDLHIPGGGKLLLHSPAPRYCAVRPSTYSDVEFFLANTNAKSH